MEILSLRRDPSTAKFEGVGWWRSESCGSRRRFICSWLIRPAQVGRTSAAIIERRRPRQVFEEASSPPAPQAVLGPLGPACNTTEARITRRNGGGRQTQSTRCL